MYAGPAWHLILVVTAACTLRVAVVISVWLHEAAHLVAAAMLGSSELMTGANITGITEAPVLEVNHSVSDVHCDFRSSSNAYPRNNSMHSIQGPCSTLKKACTQSGCRP